MSIELTPAARASAVDDGEDGVAYPRGRQAVPGEHQQPPRSFAFWRGVVCGVGLTRANTPMVPPLDPLLDIA